MSISLTWPIRATAHVWERQQQRRATAFKTDRQAQSSGNWEQWIGEMSLENFPSGIASECRRPGCTRRPRNARYGVPWTDPVGEIRRTRVLTDAVSGLWSKGALSMMIERETGNQLESHFRTGWEEKGKIIILFCPVPMTRPGKGTAHNRRARAELALPISTVLIERVLHASIEQDGTWGKSRNLSEYILAPFPPSQPRRTLLSSFFAAACLLWTSNRPRFVVPFPTRRVTGTLSPSILSLLVRAGRADSASGNCVTDSFGTSSLFPFGPETPPPPPPPHPLRH